MRTISLVLAGLFLLLLVACSGVIGTNSPSAGLGGLNPIAGNKDKIVGQWDQVIEGPAMGISIMLEFTKDGKTKMTGPFPADGTYTVDGDKLTMITKVGNTEVKTVSTIQTLNDTELVIKAEKGGTVSKYKRKK
jgi:uncharacterized protein (TIGR03066 family)